MAKLKDAIVLLASNPANKELVASLQADFGGVLEVESQDLAAQLSRAAEAEKTIETLTGQVKDLDGKAKGAEALQATLAEREKTLSGTYIGSAFAAAAKQFGVKDSALGAARKLADLSGVKADLKTGNVTGLTREIFEGLKKDASDLFIPAAGAPAPVGNVAPMPPLNGGASANAVAASTPQMPGAMGLFQKAFALPKA